MKVRRLVLVILAVLALSGATLGAALAAPRGQEAGGGTLADGRPERQAQAYLGLETTKLTKRIAAYLELPEEVTGLLVMGAQPGSPADGAGLVRGDVVLSIDGVVLETPGNLQRLIRSKAPGDVIEVVYYRDGARTAVSITLADAADHTPPPMPRWLNQVQSFMRAFPNAIDGTFRILGNDNVVSHYVVTPGTVVEVGEASVVVENRLGELATYDVVDGTVIVRGTYRVALDRLTVGMAVVMLEVDDVLKEIVLTRAAADDAEPIGTTQLDEMRANNRGAITSAFRAYINELREEFKTNQDRGDVQELIEKLQARIAELMERLIGGDAGGDDADQDTGDDSSAAA
jgi:hypothetical protein